jgi:hypothetical protein
MSNSYNLTVGASGIRFKMLGFKIYMPALMWLPTNVCGFSTK